MSGARVTGLYRYPVKSLMGESLETVTLGPRGVPGDRAWAVRDEIRGGIRGAKRFPELMQVRAWYDEPPPAEGSSRAAIEFPDGRRMAIDAAEAPAALGELVGSEVSVWPLMPAKDLDHYRRGPPLTDDPIAELRRIFGRTPEESLPDLSVFPELLATYESPPGTYFDAFPLLVMTENSLRYLQALGTPAFDVRRFRPNVLLNAPDDDPFPENDWVGQRFKVGSAVLQMEIGCPRCSMTTRAFDDLPEDPGIMRSLVRNAGGNLGIYASVLEDGRVDIGDSFQRA